MKININNGDLSGYLNSGPDVTMVDDSSCTEILAPFAVNSIHYQQLSEILGLWKSKLRLNGVLKLGGYDLVEFSKRVVRYEIEAEQKNQVICDSGSFLSLDEITQLCEGLGFIVLKRKLDGIHYLLEMRRA